MKISAAIRTQAPDRIVESVRASNGETFQSHLERARVCAECGRAVATYQDGLCRECLKPSLRRGTNVINRGRGV